MNRLYFVSALLVVFISCNKVEKIKQDKFIDKPLKDVETPFQEYKVNAQKGDTLIYQTGSIILFHPSSFVDAKGAIVEGEVRVRYREFFSPVDYYLSGIPMVYDSSGSQYVFKSTAMFELVAAQNGIPVYVNQQQKPEVHIARNSTEPSNLYFLDTIGKKWIYKGTTVVTKVPDNASDKETSNNVPNANVPLLEPVKPEKATNSSPIIKIVVDSASFKELVVYNNLKFQLDVKEKNFNPKDADEEWSNVVLHKGKTKGNYIVKFSNSKRAVEYNAKPVLEGADYEKALKVYEQKRKEYDKKYKERLVKEDKDRKQYIADSIKHQKIAAENQRIEEENQRIYKLNKLIEARNREVERQNEIIIRENKRRKEADQYGRIVTSFRIDRFGISNCDVAKMPNAFPIVAEFFDEQGNKLSINFVAVFYKNYNGILRQNGDTLKFLPGDENMIFGVSDERLAYLSFEDVRTLNLNAQTKSQKFVLKVVSKKDNNYEFIKSIANLQ